MIGFCQVRVTYLPQQFCHDIGRPDFAVAADQFLHRRECMYVCMYLYMHICMYVCMYVCMHLEIEVCRIKSSLH